MRVFFLVQLYSAFLNAHHVGNLVEFFKPLEIITEKRERVAVLEEAREAAEAALNEPVRRSFTSPPPSPKTFKNSIDYNDTIHEEEEILEEEEGNVSEGNAE